MTVEDNLLNLIINNLKLNEVLINNLVYYKEVIKVNMLKDSITQIKELVEQKIIKELSVSYTKDGLDHLPIWTCKLTNDDKKTYFVGTGKTKKIAHRIACEKYLKILKAFYKL